jgi:hypothetical protein
MRTHFAVVLIVAGVILFLTPAVQDMLSQSHHARLLQLPEFRGTQVIEFKGEFSRPYRCLCYGVGLGLIGIAVIGSFLGSRKNAA